MTPFRPITIPNGDEPLFSPPIKNYQCISPVKNLDDPKIAAYYDDLQIISRENVHRELTRAEFVKMIINSANLQLEKADLNLLKNFTDIDKYQWFAPYVAYAIEYGLVSGQEAQKNNALREFRPNDNISRAEASKILTSLILKDANELPTTDNINTFSDVNNQDSLSPYIQYAYNTCLLHGRNTIDGKPID